MTPESCVKVMRKKEMITNSKNLLIVKQILPVSNCTFARKCIENSMENMHTDVRMDRVNIINCNF